MKKQNNKVSRRHRWQWFRITSTQWGVFMALAFCVAVSAPAQDNETSKARNDDLSRLRPQEPVPVNSGALEKVIEDGVGYLLKTQRADGAWGGPQWTGGVDRDPVPGSFRAFEIAVAAMCLEVLLHEQNRLGEQKVPELEDAIDRAYDYLLSKTGKIRRAGPGDLPHIWSHCYCIQTFVKMYQDPRHDARRADLSTAIASHMKGLKRWQSIHGGWFYYGSGMSKPINPSCSFVNAAVLVALAEARDAGFHADQTMIRKAIKATQLMRKPDSSFIYSLRTSAGKAGAARPINRPAGSLGRSQAGNISLRMWDDPNITNAVIETWLNRLITRHGWLDMGRKKPIPHESFAAVAGYFYYFGVYYGARCIDAIDSEKQDFYRHHVATLIMERQELDGSWFDYPLYSYHKPYGTAFALLTLQRCRIN